MVIVRLIAGLVALSLLMAACAPPTPPPTPAATTVPVKTAAPVSMASPTPAPTLPPPSKYKEAPALAEQVKAGKLPAVDARLPKNPMVVKPWDKVGKYGGTWRMIGKSSLDDASFRRTTAYENLVRWIPDWSGVMPNLAESYTVNPNSTEYTFKLRDGLKWSDGQPYTTDDIKFWYEDVLMNKDLTPSIANTWKAGGKALTIEVVDKLTFKVKFESPNGLFLFSLAAPDGAGISSLPAHWAKKYHQKYSPAEVEKLVKDGQFKSWADMWTALVSNEYADPSRPRMYAWLPTAPYGRGAITQLVFERNPYYWKVDPEGNQLPYIDKVTFSMIDNVEAMLPKIMNGEIEMQFRHFNTNANKSILFDNKAKGNYDFYSLSEGAVNMMVIYFNQTHDDPVKRQIFSNKDFRIGLSFAINRPEIIKTILVGQGEVSQVCPPKGSPVYDEKLCKQYTEFDLAKANEYLDKAGFKKDASGKRLGPDGKPISFVVESSDTQTQVNDMMNMIVKYWKEVGIDASLKVEERTAMYNSKAANAHDVVLWNGASGYLPNLLVDPRYWMPFSDESAWGIGWVRYNLKTPGGEKYEPPAEVKKSIELYNKIVGTADPKQQVEFTKEMLANARDSFWTIGIVQPADGYGVVKNNFKNVPKSMPMAWIFPTFAPLNPEQFYIE
jgi:peptide/nickel transport system substrate-binding protein